MPLLLQICFLVCYERDFMLSPTPTYLENLPLLLTNGTSVSQICPTELQLNKAHSLDTKAPFF